MTSRPADQIVHKAAWLYYTHGLRQDEVAQRLDISRASVALYLRRAREAGIVSISTSTKLFRHERFARQIEDFYGLDAVWVARDGVTGDAADEIPSLAPGVFLEMVENGHSLGGASGRTRYENGD